MSTVAADEARDFVVARWADLEAVAVVATLDPASARELTTATFATLRTRWREVSEGGSPTREARRELFRRLRDDERTGRGLRSPGRRPVAEEAAPQPGPALREAVDDPSSAVPGRLLEALAAEPPLVRAAGAAVVLWDLPGPGPADLLGDRSSTLLDEVSAARARLLDAHRAARHTDGLDPADHRFDDDLADLLHRLAAATGAPPDPEDLVQQRSGRLRRRSLLLGGAGVAGVVGLAGAGAVALSRRRGSGGGAAGADPVPPLPGPEDPVWAFTHTWPARGSLRGDPRFAAVLVDPSVPGPGLIYADDVAGRRVAVVGVDDAANASTAVSLWVGPEGAPPEQLVPVPLDGQSLFSETALVAVGVPVPDGAVLLVLTRPRTTDAELSLVVRPTPAGDITREWAPQTLTGGVGVVRLDTEPGLATRLRCGGYDGPPLRPQEWDERARPSGVDAAEDLVRSVAAATGVARDRLRVESTSFRLPGKVSVFGGAVEGTVTIRRSLVTTPDGALVRSVVVSAEGPGTSATAFGDPVSVIPARAREATYLTQLDDDLTGGATFAVVTPPGGARVRFYGSDDTPLGPASPVRRRAAVVRSTTYETPSRIVVRDADDEVVSDGPPLEGRYLYDLFGDVG